MLDVYGLTETMGPGVAIECWEQTGLHLAEDHFYAEIIDPATGENLPDGEWGELVLTSVDREACPVVRYRTRDITRILPGECACGRTHRRIDRLHGRTDDMLIIRGVNVFPSQIEDVVKTFPQVASWYQIELDTKGALDTVTLKLEVNPGFAFDVIGAIEQLQKEIQRGAQERPVGGNHREARRASHHRAQRGQGQARRRPAKGDPLMIEQITVFLENREGRLAKMCRCIADAGVNMSALTIADTSEYGVVRIVCDDPAKAVEALEAGGYRAIATKVVAVAVPNRPAGLAELLDVLDKLDLNIEYGYCFSLRGDRAVDVLRFQDADKAAEAIKAAGFTLLELDDLK